MKKQQTIGAVAKDFLRCFHCYIIEENSHMFRRWAAFLLCIGQTFPLPHLLGVSFAQFIINYLERPCRGVDGWSFLDAGQADNTTPLPR
jgi:hypothetical protein